MLFKVGNLKPKLFILSAIVLTGLLYINADTFGPSQTPFLRGFVTFEDFVRDTTLGKELWPMLGLRIETSATEAYFPQKLEFRVTDLRPLGASGACCLFSENGKTAVLALDYRLYRGSDSADEIIPVGHSAVLRRMSLLGTAMHEYFHFNEISSGVLAVRFPEGHPHAIEASRYDEIRAHMVSNYFDLAAITYAQRYVPSKVDALIAESRAGITRVRNAIAVNEIEINRISGLLKPNLTLTELRQIWFTGAPHDSIQATIPSTRTGVNAGLTVLISPEVKKAGSPPTGALLVTVSDPLNNPSGANFSFRVPREYLNLTGSVGSGVFNLGVLQPEARMELMALVYGFVVQRVRYAKDTELPNFKVIAGNQETLLDNLATKKDRSTRANLLTAESGPSVLKSGPLLPSAPGLSPRLVDPHKFAQSVPIPIPRAMHDFSRLYDPTLGSRPIGTFYQLIPGGSVTVGNSTIRFPPSVIPLPGR